MAGSPTPRPRKAPEAADSVPVAAHRGTGLGALAGWPLSDADQAMHAWWHAARVRPSRCVAIACSGGADSVALLLATVRLLLRLPAGAQPFHLACLHVHHGLQAAADDFAAHVRQLCENLNAQVLLPAGLPAMLHGEQHVQVRQARGDSIEAQARLARYEALADMAGKCGADRVLLGQHAHDQTETLLLALGRGAGMAGLAAMPAAFERHGMHFERPLIHVAPQSLRQWLEAHHVGWMDDPSNADQTLTRNRLRHAVVPMWQQAIPGLHKSVARTARLAAEADQLLAELAQQDLVHAGIPPRISLLQSLSRARQANALRYWLKNSHGVIGSEAQMHALLDVVEACTTRGHRIRIKVGRGYVTRDGLYLHWGLVQ